MNYRFAELLDMLRAAEERNDVVDPLTDEIEALAAADPQGCREATHSYQGDEMTRLWALGLVQDARDFDVLVGGLASPDAELRFTALEALAGQPDTARVDALARKHLDDPDSGVRSKASGLVAFHRLPGALDALLPLADDPDPDVRMALAWRIRLLPGAEPMLRKLLGDPDGGVREWASKALAPNGLKPPHLADGPR